LGLPSSALSFYKAAKTPTRPFLGVNFVNLAEQTSNTPSPPFVQMGLTLTNGMFSRKKRFLG
jgi:hypothetical protein